MKRGRGRPPKNPIVSAGYVSVAKRKKTLRDAGSASSSRSSTPLSCLSTPSRGRTPRAARTNTREAAKKSKKLIAQVIGFEDKSVVSEHCPTSELEDHDSDSDFIESDSESVYSESSFQSYSTVSSTPSRRKNRLPRPPTPPGLLEVEIPPLQLPSSSDDLLLDNNLVLTAVSIYETLRHFKHQLRLSPFRFEDFCAALQSQEQCALLAETHICLLKALLREDEGNSTTFGPHDTKDSINIQLFFVDGMTWPELVRAYIESDSESQSFLHACESENYPYKTVADKLKTLQFLTDQFLSSNVVREDILNEGAITYDDHCRNCHKMGDLLCCETCSAVYHLECVNPPLEEVPEEDWVCEICAANQVSGVTDCISEVEKSGLLIRHEPLGYDRHGRKYWFLCRRLIIEGESEVYYFSTKAQMEELMHCLNSKLWEADLCRALSDQMSELLDHMKKTEDLTNQARGNLKSALDNADDRIQKERLDREEANRKAEEETKQREDEAKQKVEEEAKQEEDNAKQEEMQKDVEEKMTEGMNTDTMATPSAEITVNNSDGESLQTNQDVTAAVTTDSESQITDVSSKISEDRKNHIAEEEKSSRSTTKQSDTKIVSIQSLIPGATKRELEIQDKDDTSTKTTDTDGNKATPKTFVFLNKDGTKLTYAISSSTNTKPTTTAASTTDASDKPTEENKVDDSEEKNKDEKKNDDNDEKDKGEEQTSPKTSPTTTIMTRSRNPNYKPPPPKSTSYVTYATSKSAKSIAAIANTATKTTTSTPSSSSSSGDTILVINAQGEITRVNTTKNADGTLTINANNTDSLVAKNQQLFKLGMEGNYKLYKNAYTANTLGLNKPQHAEDRDKRRQLSHKFSLTQMSEFKWNGTVHGSRVLTISTLRLSITQLETNIAAPFLHSNWTIHRNNWVKAVHMCSTAREFSLALAILESAIKPVIFNPVWNDSLGHTRMQRMTVLEREEKKKADKKKNDDDEVDRTHWVRYTFRLKHQ
uniref:Nucleosome-remodeling factor subunit BPTF-like n=1 Tax=Saccoglossus kowalevskii TaxID=10224 RepID=A0ABM0MW96_SACKO